MRTRRHSKARWAFLLAGAIFALTAMAGPDAVQHLRTSTQDFHTCALYHWTHGAGSGAPSCISLPVPLPVVGAAASAAVAAAPDVSIHLSSPRAPPSIA